MSEEMPEIVEIRPEKRPNWLPTNPRCEAQLSKKILQEGNFDGMYDPDGRKVHFAPGVKEAPEARETTIDCARCPVHESFKSEGMGYTAANDASWWVNKFLQSHCAKLLSRGYRSGQIPEDLLPSTINLYPK